MFLMQLNCVNWPHMKVSSFEGLNIRGQNSLHIEIVSIWLVKTIEVTVLNTFDVRFIGDMDLMTLSLYPGL